MPVIRPIRELQNTTEISHFAKTLNEPIFITKNGRNDLVLMNDAVYERIMAQNEMYRKLAAAEAEVAVPFPVSWTVKMKKKQKETQDILSYHTQAAGCSDKARAKASGGRQPIEECGRTGL